MAENYPFPVSLKHEQNIRRMPNPISTVLSQDVATHINTLKNASHKYASLVSKTEESFTSCLTSKQFENSKMHDMLRISKNTKEREKLNLRKKNLSTPVEFYPHYRSMTACSFNMVSWAISTFGILSAMLHS